VALPEESCELRRALAAAMRELIDATVTTGVDDATVATVTAEVSRLAAVLGAVRHPGPMTGLLGKIDITRPLSYLPLTPMAGPYNPIAPPMDIRVEGDRSVATVTLGRGHTGPPGFAHGGTSASMCDQMLGVAAWTRGFQGFTRRIEVTFRRPVPLYTELEVVAWVEDLGEDLTIARCAIRLDDQDLVTGRGEVIRAERLTSRAGASP
jgi:acyl-coenzyme A thioesterase PaaI-like protein